MRYLRLAVIRQSIAWLVVMSATAHGFDCLAPNGASVLCPGPRWTNGGTTLQSSLGNTWNQDALNAANEWNATGAAFHYTVQFVPGGPINDPCGPSSPGDNPVFLANSVCGQGFGDIVAQTNAAWDQNDSMISAPVFLNNTVTWDAYDGPIQFTTGGQPINDIRRVLLHEFGHVLGLGHPDQLSPPQNVAAIMNSGESDVYTLRADDIAGIFSLYPNGSSAGGPNGPLPSIGCQTAPGSATDAWTLALPAFLLALRRRKKSKS